MKRLTTSVMAVGLVVGLAAGSASAQSSGYGTYQGNGYYQGDGTYGQPTVDRYGQSTGYGQGPGGYYDYARVLRVDPVIASGGGRYPASDYRNCRTAPGPGNNGYADNGGYYGNDPYGNDPYGNNGYRNDGGYGAGGYGNQGYGGSNGGRTMATVIGGVLGAAIGSQVGGGSARYATSAIGSMVGGIAGRQIYENSHRPVGTVQVCDPVPVRGSPGYYGTDYRSVTAYDVTYEYGGRSYTTRTSYNPGNRIRVRVDVRPE